jgi:hypothetical protein
LEPEFIEILRNVRKRKADKFRHQLSVFILCLGISVFLWILVHLSKEYFYTTEYRLKYKEVPWNMKLIRSSDSILIVTIRIQGYEYFSEKLFHHKQQGFDVSLRGLKVQYNGDEAAGYMLTRGIARNISEQAPYPFEVFSTAPDTLFFTFERKTVRKMVVKPSSQALIPVRVDSSRLHPDSIRRDVYRPESGGRKKTGKSE